MCGCKTTILLLVLACVPWQSHGGDAGVRKFQDIAARLDIGGDLFLVVHTGRWLDAVLARLEGGADAVPPSSAEERDLRDASGRARRFAARQGISGLEGIGISSMPLQGGQSSVKVFLLRDAQDANLPFWRGLFGWQPRRLLSLDFLPADAEFVWASTPDFEGLWQLLESARVDLGQASLERMLGHITQASLRLVEMEPLPMLQSLRDELLLCARHVAGEDGGAHWEWLAIVGTGEESLFRAAQQVVARRGVPVEHVVVGGHSMQRIAAPVGSNGARLLPQAFAAVPGFFVIGSSPRIVEDALRSQRHRSGLLARPAFIDAFRGQNMVNNGLLYVSPQGAETLRLLQEQRVKQSLPDDLEAFPQYLLEALAAEGARGAVFALTLANWRQGIMISGRSGIGGTAMGSWLGAFPTAWWYALPQWVEDRLASGDDLDIGY